MTQDYWKQLTDKYFEAETTPEEERALREFLARTDDPAFDEARAVLGYFSAQRGHRVAKVRVRTLTASIAAAAAIALVAILGHDTVTLPDDTCVIYAYGEKNTDRQAVLDDMNQTLAELFAGNQGPDVSAQLNEFFN